MSKAPAFQFYAADWLSDEKVAVMTPAQEGFYIRALAFCWREGTIPSEDNALIMLLAKGPNIPSEEDLRVVKACFMRGTNQKSRLVHFRLELEREKQAEWSLKSSKGGKLSVEVRKRKRLMDKLSGLTTLETVVEPPIEPSSNSSSSSSSYSDPPIAPLSEKILGARTEREFPDMPEGIQEEEEPRGQPPESLLKRRGKKPGRGIPEEWRPTPKTIAWAIAQGLTAEQVERILQEFVLYWRGDGGLKADWDATFKNRIVFVQGNAHVTQKFNGRSVTNGVHSKAPVLKERE